jgi:hypothetical protein
VTIGLELGRFLAEGAPDAFTDLQLGPCFSSFKVRESISTEIFDLRKNGLQLLDALGQIIDPSGF